MLAYALLSRVRFHAGVGHTVPTQLAFVPMLFLVPTELVPLLVLLGMLIGNLPDYARGVLHPGRALMLPGDAWHAIGPALVLLAAGASAPGWGDWPWYLLALASQFAFDFAVYALRARLALDVPGREQLRALALGVGRRRAARPARARSPPSPPTTIRTRSCSCCRSPRC